MRSKSFDGMACSIAGALEAIGYRWAVLILRDLSLGLSRYEELRRSTGVTNATLSDRLKHLEDNELIERRRYQVWLRSRARADPFHCRRAGQIARRLRGPNAETSLIDGAQKIYNEATRRDGHIRVSHGLCLATAYVIAAHFETTLIHRAFSCNFTHIK
jgi:DNA-binding Lrp family transcriptional regulator